MHYTELHLHDYFSALDGLDSPAGYFERAKELDMTHLAQTNHGTLIGHREFQREAEKAGITPILGVEAYISATDRFDKRSNAKREDGTSAYNHIILLAQNETGLGTMYKLNEAAWSEGFYNKPRIDMDLLEEHNEGLIVLSGCMGGLISKAFERGDMETAYNIARRLKSILKDRFFIEVQSHNPLELNANLLNLADTLNIKPVITSDCHYARKEDLWIEEAMLIISTNPKANYEADLDKAAKMDFLERYNYLYPDRKMTFQEIEIYLKSAQEHLQDMKKRGFDRADVVENTNLVKDMIGEYPFHQGLDLLPKPKNDNPDTLLEKKARAGLRNRGLDKDPKYVARLEEELEIIKSKNFSTYFLIVANMIRWAKSQEIMVGPGRGSAAGSLVCYALEITEVDPLEYGLLFFRFINPERNDFPDIDTDFEDARRSEVKDYLRRQFKHVAEIMTINKFQGKNALNAAAKVLRVPKADVARATKKIDAPTDKPELFYDMLKKSKEGSAFIKEYPDALKLSKQLTGRIAFVGKHPAGIVVSKEPLNNFMPIETAANPDKKVGGRVPVIAADMEEAADTGAIKLDALGLKTLTVINDTLKEIKRQRGIEIDPNTIPLNDRKTYQMLSDGYTRGVFQAEGPAFTKWILDTGCEEFNDIVVGSSIARPGPMNTIGPEFKLRKAGKSKVTYEHPVMKNITEETLGLIVYQEQVMLAMHDLAGMTMATADKVRKIIGKKRDVKEFEKYQDEFIEGAAKRVDRAVAEKLWHDFEEHAGYSFNKSHAVAYGLLTYWTAWLKTNYSVEFMYALLKSEGDPDKMTEYLIEAKRLGLKILLPHVNKSDLEFTIEDGNIRFGLIDIKGIAEKTGTKLLEYRPFENYEQLKEKVAEKGSGLTSTVLKSLNAIGAAHFDDNPKHGQERDNLYEYLRIPAFQYKELPPRVLNQFRTLDEYEDKGTFFIMAMARKIVRKDHWARVDLLDETGTAGVFTNGDTPMEAGQMYVMMVSNNSIERYVSIDDLTSKSRNTFVQYLYAKSYPELTDGCYKTIAFRRHVTKSGNNMAYMIVTDGDKNLTRVMAFPQQFAKAHMKCKEGQDSFMEFKKTEDGSLFLHNVY
jgi:DNA polymerase-3 subunit alpha